MLVANVASKLSYPSQGFFTSRTLATIRRIPGGVREWSIRRKEDVAEEVVDNEHLSFSTIPCAGITPSRQHRDGVLWPEIIHRIEAILMLL